MKKQTNKERKKGFKKKIKKQGLVVVGAERSSKLGKEAAGSCSEEVLSYNEVSCVSVTRRPPEVSSAQARYQTPSPPSRKIFLPQKGGTLTGRPLPEPPLTRCAFPFPRVSGATPSKGSQHLQIGTGNQPRDSLNLSYFLLSPQVTPSTWWWGTTCQESIT